MCGSFKLRFPECALALAREDLHAMEANRVLAGCSFRKDGRFFNSEEDEAGAWPSPQVRGRRPTRVLLNTLTVSWIVTGIKPIL